MTYTAWSVTINEQPTTAKWNIIGTNNAGFVDGTSITNGSIYPNLFGSLGQASTWVWGSWTPSWTNVTQGTGGSNTGAYIVIGRICFARFMLKLGTAGASVGGDISFAPPVNAKVNDPINEERPVGNCTYVDDSTTNIYNGTIGQYSTTQFRPNITQVGTFSYAYADRSGASIPFTWAVSDAISGYFWYEVA